MAWPRNRTRRLSVGLLLAAIALALMLAVSTRCVFGVLLTSHTGAACVAGQLVFGYSEKDIGADVRSYASSFGPFFVLNEHLRLHWGFDYDGTGTTKLLGVPLWLLTLLSAASGAILFYRTRPSLIGLCRKCRYNLTGLPPTSPCPECGKPPTPKEA